MPQRVSHWPQKNTRPMTSKAPFSSSQFHLCKEACTHLLPVLTRALVMQIPPVSRRACLLGGQHVKTFAWCYWGVCTFASVNVWEVKQKPHFEHPMLRWNTKTVQTKTNDALIAASSLKVLLPSQPVAVLAKQFLLFISPFVLFLCWGMNCRHNWPRNMLISGNIKRTRRV